MVRSCLLAVDSESPQDFILVQDPSFKKPGKRERWGWGRGGRPHWSQGQDMLWKGGTWSSRVCTWGVVWSILAEVSGQGLWEWGTMLHDPVTIILTLTVTGKGRCLSKTVVKVREWAPTGHSSRLEPHNSLQDMEAVLSVCVTLDSSIFMSLLCLLPSHRLSFCLSC